MSSAPPKEQEERERYEALEQLEDWLEIPVMVLGVLWLVLLLIEFIWGLNAFLNTLVYIIWGVFVFDFIVRLILAPHKVEYLKSNWLTALSLFVPALRVGRLARLLRLTRATQGIRLVKVVSSLNRGMRILRATMRRRGFGYVMLLTLVVTLVGAAGMYTFEQPAAVQAQTGLPGAEGLRSYGEAVWWTAMVMTTMGSAYWPQTAEGRMLTLLLAVYAFAVFGYVTATLATFFLGSDRRQEQDAQAPAGEGENVSLSLQALAAEIARLREEVQRLRAAQAGDRLPPDLPA